MSNQEVEVKVGMWIQIPKLTKKQEKTLLDIKCNKKYEIIKIIGGKDKEVVIKDEAGDEHHIPLNQNEWLFGKPLILLDKNQQLLTKSTKKETVKESKPQITAQEMYIKELEKTAKSLREQVENLEEEVAIRDKIITNANKDIEHFEKKLDESYKEQEEMFKNVKDSFLSHKDNLIGVLESTDSLQRSDIIVFTDIQLRSLERVWKFESKED